MRLMDQLQTQPNHLPRHNALGRIDQQGGLDLLGLDHMGDFSIAQHRRLRVGRQAWQKTKQCPQHGLQGEFYQARKVQCWHGPGVFQAREIAITELYTAKSFT